MSVETIAPPAATDPDPAPARAHGLGRAAALGLVLGAAYGPPLLLHARGLWARPDLQFFPLILLGAGVLARRESRDLGPLEPGDPTVTGWLLAGAWSALALAAGVMSPWLGVVAALLMLPAVAYACGGRRLAGHLLPAWLVLWVAVPPPLGLDERLVRGLRGVVTGWSSGVLDVLGVVHVPHGNVIEVPGKQLLIQEACSGIQSLYVTVAATWFFALLSRRSAARSLLLLATAVVWALLGNVARIVAIVGSFDQAKVDLSAGWRHELLGVLILFLTLGLIASSDGVYDVVAAVARGQWKVLARAWRRWRRARLLAGGPIRPPVLSNAPAPEPAPAIEPGPTRLPDLARTGLARRPVLAAFGVLAVVQWVGLWPWLVATSAGGPSTLAARLEASLTTNTMPPRCALMERVRFDSTRREQGSRDGEFSRFWTYRLGAQQAVASVDFPFRGWHELPACYDAQGWTLETRTVRPGAIGSFVEAEFSTPASRHGYLVFRLFDESGRPVEIAEPWGTGKGLLAGIAEVPRARLHAWREMMRRPRRPAKPIETDQVQVFVESRRPLTPEDRDQARQLLDATCERVLAVAAGGRRSAE